MDRPHNDPADFGVFETLPYIPGGPGGEMKCPTCTENTPDAWKPLWVINDDNSRTHGLRRGHAGLIQVAPDWMHCANNKCGELVIRVHQTTHTPGQGEAATVSWFACPRTAQRPIDPVVQGNYRRDYQEAAAILDTSPRMSAVLSRRILADLLRHYAGQDQYRLPEQIDAFRADTAHPSHVRQPLHHLREIADFGAHTQTDDQTQIIDVGKEEAEWTLDIIDRLFDYFIVSPEKDKNLYESMDRQLEQAGRKPIKPLPDAEASNGAV